MDRGPREYYTSEEKVLPVGARMCRISWFGECTSTSWVEMEVRAAENSEKLQKANWIRVENSSDILSLDLHGIVQYGLALCANCSCGTPRISRVEADICETY